MYHDVNLTNARYGFAAAISAWAHAASRTPASRDSAEIAKYDRGAMIARRRMDDTAARLETMRRELARHDAEAARRRAGL